MAIYIKGMELPKDGHIYMAITNKGEVITHGELQIIQHRGRQALFCIGEQKLLDTPAVCIPEPHGRLIDADLLAKEMRKGQQTSKAKVWALLTKYAPTVIEGSE